jgi:haloalkane dehalogenase
VGARPGWLDDELYPFRSRFVEIDGHLVHYVDEGTGPVLLMLHGNPTWSFVYRGVITALRDRFRCVAPDYPGFGLSAAAPDYGHRPADHATVIAKLVDHLDLSDITLVVQDWGGPIGFCVAEQRPAAFAGLVVGNSWAWPVNGDPHFEIFSWVMGGPVGQRLIGRFNLFVNAMIPAGHRRRKLSATEMAHYRQPLATPARRHATAVFPRELVTSRDFLTTIEAGLPAVAHLPALIVWADRDIAFRRTERERWESLLSNHSTVILHGAGHYLQSDAPDEFAAAIGDWHHALQPRAQAA